MKHQGVVEKERMDERLRIDGETGQNGGDKEIGVKILNGHGL